MLFIIGISDFWEKIAFTIFTIIFWTFIHSIKHFSAAFAQYLSEFVGEEYFMIQYAHSAVL